MAERADSASKLSKLLLLPEVCYAVECVLIGQHSRFFVAAHAIMAAAAVV